MPPAPRSAGQGGRPLPKGRQGPPPRPLYLGWFLAPLLALGFSNGYEACPAPPPREPLSSSNRPRAGAALWLPGTQPGLGGQGPLSSHSCPRCLQGPVAACPPPAQHPWPRPPPTDHAWFSKPPLPTVRSLLLIPYPHPTLPSPRIISLCINRTLLVRKQYPFRSKEERDSNLVEGKFSFTV